MNDTDRIKKLEEEVAKIKLRNIKVEQNKAWETSIYRKLIITILTYVVMCLIMSQLDVERFYLSAIIPTLGFVLSSLSLNFFKRIWIRYSSKA